MLEHALTMGQRGTEHIQWKSPQDIAKQRLDEEISEMLKGRSTKDWQRKKKSKDLFGIQAFKNKLK